MTDAQRSLRTSTEQSWQENDAATAMNANAVRGHDAFAAHSAQLEREAAERRAHFRRAFGDSDA